MAVPPNIPGTEKLPTLTEITGIVSNQLHLPPELEAVRNIAARVEEIAKSNPALAAAGPEGVKALVWSITPDDPAKMDPAKQAEAMLARANITSADSAAWGKVLETYRSVMAGNLSKEDAGEGKAEAYLSVVDLQQINKDNFMFTEFATRAGLDFGMFSQLRSQGFNAQQIMHAAGFTKEMGLDVNKDAVVVARLQRDQPDANPAMRDMRDNERGLADAKQKLAEAEKQSGTKPEELERLRTRVQEWQTYADQYHTGYREKAITRVPSSGEDVDTYRTRQQIVNKTLKVATADMTPEQQTEAERIFEDHHRHPEDAATSWRYAETFGPYQNGKAAKQLAQAEAGREQLAITRDAKAADTAQTDQRSDVKQTQKAANSQALSDAGAALFAADPPDTPQQKAEAKPKPERPTQVVANTGPGNTLSPQRG